MPIWNESQACKGVCPGRKPYNQFIRKNRTAPVMVPKARFSF